MPASEMRELRVPSTLDGAMEKNLFSRPEGGRSVPLVVGLHTWSHDRFNQEAALLSPCRERGWALLLPEFRGSNCVTNPRARNACASSLAKQDVVDALDYVLAGHGVDERFVFLLGGSGGGHMALMLAAYAPKRWTAVSSWCPITDLARWHGENRSYSAGIEACCGGAPGGSTEASREYYERSPLNFAKDIAAARVWVHHGRNDRSVPYTHSLRLALELERLAAPAFYFNLFDGGHELRCAEAFAWFDRICRSEDKERLTG